MSKTIAKASRVSVSTILKVGGVEAPIALYKAIGDPKPHKWEQADVEGNPWTSGNDGALSEPPAAQGDPLGDRPQQTPSSAAPMGGPVPPADPGAQEVEQIEEEKPRKGIRKEDGAFVDLTEQIEKISERATLERMEVISFIDRSHVPRERIIGTYYLGAGSGESGLPPSRLLKVLTVAMRQTGRVAVVRFSKRKGQTLGAVVPRRDDSLLLLELCFAEQFRAPGPKALTHTQAMVRFEEVSHAGDLILAMAGRRNSLDGIRNMQVVMEEELISRAEEGELDSYEPPEDSAVDPAMDQLAELLREAAEAAKV